jgi:hypothetical protein
MNFSELEREPATVFWFCTAPPLVARTGELRSPFATLRQALSFVLDDLPPDLQKTAWILVRGGWFAPDQLRRLSCEKADTAPAPLALRPDDAEILARLAESLRGGVDSQGAGDEPAANAA